MLHIVKQMKGIFMGIIDNRFLDKQTATDIVDSFDANKNDKISWKEVYSKFDELIKNNDKLDTEKKNLVYKIYKEKINNKVATWGSYNIDKQEFINLLTEQKVEKSTILNKKDKEVVTIKDESSNKRNWLEKLFGDIFGNKSTKNEKTV